MRRAYIDISGDNIAHCVRILQDAGLRVVGSADAEWSNEVVRLVIEGDILPKECESGRYVVSATFRQETYGLQRMVRLVDLPLVANADAA